MINKNLNAKYIKLKNYLKELKTAAVAFSSGVDSTFLLKTAKEVLGSNIIAISANFNSFPQKELNEAVEFCRKEQIKHIIIEFNELDIEGFSQNPANRCYLCKKELFKNILEIAKSNNIENVLEGSNTDDVMDYRPGMQALKELNIKSPLRYSGLSKKEIRILSEKMNLPTSNKPSFACLASRFVFGETITKEKLQMVENAEQFLFDMGYNQVRVRIHNNIARIEVMPDDFENILKNRSEITDKFKNLGFVYVTMDLQGYRTGSMNETIKEKNC